METESKRKRKKRKFKERVTERKGYDKQKMGYARLDN